MPANRYHPLLLTFDQWKELHRRDRGDFVPYVFDDDRARATGRLIEVMTGDRDAAWVVGCPGVGKTRLLIELLERREDIRRRAMIAVSGVDAIRVLRERHLFDDHPGAILIVDDCSEVDTHDMFPYLPLIGGRYGLIVALTSISKDATPLAIVPPPFITGRIAIDDLRHDACKSLAKSSGCTDAAAEGIANSSGGNPWLTILEAKRLAAPDGRAWDADIEAAVCLMVCPRSDWPRSKWQELEQRMRAMVLHHGVDISRLSHEDLARWAALIGCDSVYDMEALVRRCKRRGVLRRINGANVIVPPMLEREIRRTTTRDMVLEARATGIQLSPFTDGRKNMIQCKSVYKQNGMEVVVVSPDGAPPTRPAEQMTFLCFAPPTVKDDILFEWFIAVIGDHERWRDAAVKSAPLPFRGYASHPERDEDARYTMTIKNASKVYRGG